VEDLSDKQILRLRATLRNMPSYMLSRLAEEYEVEIPFDAPDIYAKINSLMDDLSSESKKRILSRYGDAGRCSSFVFISRRKTPSITEVLKKTGALQEIRTGSEYWEARPYYDEVELDHATQELRIRFNYLLGSVPLIDESTGVVKEHRHFWRGAVIYRPESRVLEVRVKHSSMARRVSAMVPAHLGLDPFFSLNLMSVELNKRFIDWISSLNSATIELPLSDTMAGSLIITARKGMDLRTAQRYHEELRFGRLRHGHVTIERNEDHKVNFHIWFRNSHMKFTLFTREEDIAYIMSALERISEGYEFARPEKLLTEFFGKKA